MTDKDKINILENCFTQVIWMAIRYADGRHTYAPGVVRNTVRDFKKVFPNWKPREDSTLDIPNEEDLKIPALRSDFLYDLVANNSEE